MVAIARAIAPRRLSCWLDEPFEGWRKSSVTRFIEAVTQIKQIWHLAIDRRLQFCRRT